VGDDVTRSIRDALAECLWLHRYNRRGYAWGDLQDETYKEPIRQDADHLIRMLEARGMKLVGEPGAPAHLPNLEISRDSLLEDGSTMVIRWQGGAVVIERHVGDEVTVLAEIALREALLLAGKVIRRSRTVQKEPFLAMKLAAAIEAYWYGYGETNAKANS
jgi:hypothetical protein